ncbi:unnamed protein product [Diabrotica balteata]|uniref:Uncharacterized protein n=1 Tax=Diabrotica balteata TaxID=107213 RepID=A0A9N9SR40_DIABA|nr:unnamed protein product [Diabrotica balteata]
MTVHGEQVRLFNKHKADLRAVAALPSRKVTLWAKETTVIPPHHLGHITLHSDQKSGDIFVDLQHRPWPSQFHVIPRCILNLDEDSVLPIFNGSDKPVEYLKGAVVARGFNCHEVQDLPYLECLATSTSIIRKLTFEDVNVNEILSAEYTEQLLDILNQYPECFANSIEQLGESTTTKMTIKLADDVPITYRPYRLSYSERGKVRDVVQELLDNDIIRESNSPYASPILLVKKKNGDEL